jgi:hypothetical protein
VTGRRGRRRRKLLDDLNPLNAELNSIWHLLALLGAHHILHVSRIRVKERRGYCHLKKEALGRTVWRARFGRGFGPVVRQTTKWMNVRRTNEKHTFFINDSIHLYSLMKIVCILLVHLTYVYHEARFKKRMNGGMLTYHCISVLFVLYKGLMMN